MVQKLRSLFFGFDWQLLFSALIIFGLGLATLYSIALGRDGGELFLVQKQLLIGGVGLVGLFIVSFIDFRTWEFASKWLWLGMSGLLLLTLLFGEVINGTKGWIGVGGWLFQPVELAKLVVIIVLGAYFARHGRDLDRLHNLLQSLFLVGVLAGFVFMQPDFGSAMLLFAVWVGLVLVAGVRRRYLIAFGVVSVVLVLIGWFFVFAPYQKARLLTFFSGGEANTAANYNVRQATIAVGSGGWFGRGFAEGSQSQLRFLPEAETDFIFAVVAEELGFVGLLVLLLLLALLFYRLFRLLAHSQDWFASFVVLGVIILFTVEVLINAGMTMGLFPVVGIPFPFLSAGGSSLLVHLALIGIVENIARRENTRGSHLSRVSVL